MRSKVLCRSPLSVGTKTSLFSEASSSSYLVEYWVDQSIGVVLSIV